MEQREILQSLAENLSRGRGRLVRAIRIPKEDIYLVPSGLVKGWHGRPIIEIGYHPEANFNGVRMRLATIIYVNDLGDIVATHAMRRGLKQYYLASRPLARVPLSAPNSLDLVSKKLETIVGVALQQGA